MRKSFLIFALMCLATFSFGQMVEPIKWSTSIKENGSKLELTLKADIDDHWHLYGLVLPEGGPSATTVTYTKTDGLKVDGKVSSDSKLITKFDEMFGLELNWYEGEAVLVQKFNIIDAGNYRVEGKVSYMACNDETCTMNDHYFSEKSANFNPDAAVAQAETAEEPETTETDTVVAVVEENQVVEAANDIYTPVIEELKAFGETTDTSDSSMWWIFLMGLGGGFLALFTPCVWPIIPMTVSFFLKRSGDKSKGRRDAFTYGLAIIVIYLALGLLVTAIFGASALNSLSTNAVFNIIFFLLLVVFALSFFGMFEITLPASLTSKMDAKAESTTGLLSILFMAFTLALVSFSCTGPIVGTLLVEAASGSGPRAFLGPAVGMFGFALALALPFSLFAMFPSMLKSMPKSGGWLNSVKVVLGFLELALSLKFLSVADLAYGWGILDRETFIALWVVIFVLLGMYLLGKITLPHDDKLEIVSVPRMMMALISFAYAVYLVPGLWGAPLNSASAFAPPLNTQDFNLYTNEVHPVAHDYETGLQMARNANKPLIIDFSGFGCVNCRKMEAAVWTDNQVATMLQEDFILVELKVDDRAPLAEPMTVVENGIEKTFTTIGEKNSYIQRTKFGANAQPYYVVLDANARPVTKSYAFNEDPAAFLEYLKEALAGYKNAK